MNFETWCQEKRNKWHNLYYKIQREEKKKAKYRYQGKIGCEYCDRYLFPSSIKLHNQTKIHSKKIKAIETIKSILGDDYVDKIKAFADRCCDVGC